MKNIILLTLFVAALFGASAHKTNYAESKIELSQGDKLAIVMVHFGTTNDQTRAQTLDKINEEVAARFTDAKVVEAYTSRIVIKRLSNKGVQKYTPSQVLDQLLADGYTHVILQPTHVIDGVEMESLERDVEVLGSKFKEVRIGRPLLYSPEDYAATIEALKGSVKSGCDAVMLVGHGTYEPITASYAMVDYMLKSRGLKSWHVATIEGYPSFDDGVTMLSRSGAKSVCLVPFMFVAGVHAQDDIAGEWREDLESKGYKVEVLMVGMGQNADIRKIYIDHIDFAMNNVSLDIMKKKLEYSK